MGENAVTAVEPAVGSPGEGIERFVGVFVTPSIEEDLGLAVGEVILIFVRVKKKIGGRSHIDPAEADLNPAREIDLFGEDLARFEGAVFVAVFENQDAVLALVVIARIADRVGMTLDHPEAAAGVEAHRDGLRDLRLGRDEIDRESRRQLHAGEGILRREAAAVAILRAASGNFPALGCRLRESLRVFLKVDGESLLAAADDIGTFVSVEIGDLQLNPDAGAVVDEVGDKFELLLRVERVPEPVKNLLAERAGVIALVGEVTFSGDEVHPSVPVYVREGESVHLGKSETEGILRRALSHDVVLFELARLVLLEPAETVSVGVVRGNDVHVAVPVEIIHEDLRSAAAVGEMRPLVFLPGSLCGIGGLFVPEGLLDDIGPTVAVEITDAETVTEGRRRFALFGNGVPGPWLGRISAGFVVTVGLLARADDLGETARDEIDKMRRLVRHLIGDEMHGPVAGGSSSGIQIKTCFFSGETEDEDIVFVVAVEVMDEAEEIVRVSLLRDEGLPLAEAFWFREIGPRKPEWAVGEIGFVITVEITDGGPFGVEVGEESF